MSLGGCYQANVSRMSLLCQIWIFDGRAGSSPHRLDPVVANLDGTGKVLILEGLTTAGTEAAEDFLFNEASMRPILQQASDPDGSLKSFELLIVTSSIASDALTARVIASRLH